MSLTLDTAQKSEEFVVFPWKNMVFADFNFRIFQNIWVRMSDEMTVKEDKSQDTSNSF